MVGGRCVGIIGFLCGILLLGPIACEAVPAEYECLESSQSDSECLANLLQNGSFGSMQGWDANRHAIGEIVSTDPSGIGSAASVEVTNFAWKGHSTNDGLFQCVSMRPDVQYYLEVDSFISSAQEFDPEAVLRVVAFDDADCSGGRIGSRNGVAAGRFRDEWVHTAFRFQSPTGTSSARVYLRVVKGSHRRDAFAQFDNALLAEEL